ncbi:hypothetical protein GC173_07060 [bacterium]|nr:hypothetical protein [bacterium]
MPTQAFWAGCVMVAAMLLLQAISTVAALRREIGPTRRRDLTLACAADDKELGRRLWLSLRRGLLPVFALLGLGFSISLLLILSSLVGRMVSPIEYGIFYGYVYTLPCLPIVHGVCLLFAARACRLNGTIPAGASLVAAALAVSTPLVLLLWIGFSTYVFDHVIPPNLFTLIIFLGWLGATAIISLVCLAGLPGLAWKLLTEKYPYAE